MRTSLGFVDAWHGLIPSLVTPYVVEAVGVRAARRLFVLGQSIDAEDAKRIGLVQRVAECPQVLRATANEFAASMGLVCAGAWDRKGSLATS